VAATWRALGQCTLHCMPLKDQTVRGQELCAGYGKGPECVIRPTHEQVDDVCTGPADRRRARGPGPAKPSPGTPPVAIPATPPDRVVRAADEDVEVPALTGRRIRGRGQDAAERLPLAPAAARRPGLLIQAVVAAPHEDVDLAWG